MRWSALNIDYEMNGKDLIPSFELSKKIAKFIFNIIPINMSYELFLDQNGEKISKSKGNGLSIDEWMTYGTKKVYHYLCTKTQEEQKGYILIAFLKAWMNTKNISMFRKKMNYL